MPSLVFYIEKIEKNPRLLLPSNYSIEDGQILIKLRNYIQFAKSQRNQSCKMLKCTECPKKTKTSYRMMCHLKKHVRE
jgi:hypothetical protein